MSNKTLDNHIHNHAYYEWLFRKLFQHVKNIVYISQILC